MRQAFSKRKRGLILKAYQLCKVNLYNFFFFGGLSVHAIFEEYLSSKHKTSHSLSLSSLIPRSSSSLSMTRETHGPTRLLALALSLLPSRLRPSESLQVQTSQ